MEPLGTRIDGSIVEHSSKEIEQQQVSFQVLKHSLPKASSSDIETILADRELLDCELELTPDVINRLQGKIATARH